MEPLYFNKLVYITALISALFSLLETSLQLKLKMEPRDFEYILTWEAGNNTGTPTCYNVMYTSYTSPNMKIITECSNITHSYCNLTKEFTDPCKYYIILVDQVTESGVHSANISFSPYTGTCLTSPQFEISACPSCANVTVKLSASLLKVYKELDYTVTVIRDNVKEPRVNRTSQESFHTIIGDLSLNTNYCIAVDVKTSLNAKQCTPSVPKCIILSSNNISGLILPVLCGILIPLAVVITLFFLYKTGVICIRRGKWPRTLNITPKLDYSHFKSEPEDVHPVQVTQQCKKKVCGYNSDEEDSESNAENEDFYTARGFLGQTLKSSSQEDSAEPLVLGCSPTPSKIADPKDDGAENLLLRGCSSATNEMPEPLDAEAESLQNDDISKDESPAIQIFHPFPEVDSTKEPDLESSCCSNVNLNTVVLGLSGRNHDISATLSPFEDDAVDLKELCVSEAFEQKHFTDALEMQNSEIHKLSYSWRNSNGPRESESSDSETDCVGEYMSR